MEALIFCSLCGSIPASGTWNYQNVGGVNKPVCHDCNKDLQEYNKRPFFEQLDVIDELLAEANSEYCMDMSCPHQVLGQWHYAHKDLNREHSNMNAANQPTIPRNSGESKATNE